MLATGCLVPLIKVYLSLSLTSGLRSPTKVVYRPLAPLPSFGDVLLGTSSLAREEIESIQLVTIDFAGWVLCFPISIPPPILVLTPLPKEGCMSVHSIQGTKAAPTH